MSLTVNSKLHATRKAALTKQRYTLNRGLRLYTPQTLRCRNVISESRHSEHTDTDVESLFELHKVQRQKITKIKSIKTKKMSLKLLADGHLYKIYKGEPGSGLVLMI